MKSTKLILFIILLGFTAACNNDDDATANVNLTVNFTHNWDGEEVSSADFNTVNYENANGDILSITLLRYLISDIVLHKQDRGTTTLTGYLLVDVNNNNTAVTIPNVPVGEYETLSFTFGFDEEDNTDGAYQDLNSASWNWPEMLGGGYHFMQLEGMFTDADGGTDDENPYSYHMGTARNADSQFEQNFFNVSLEGGVSIENNTIIEIEMNIAEWFKDPNVWDLNTFGVDLMSNYEAQKMMNENGQTVFSLGNVIP